MTVSKFSATFLLIAFVARGQQAPSAEAKSPAHVLEFRESAVLAGLPVPSAMGSPMHGSPEGATFLDVYADSAHPEIRPYPVTYCVSRLGEVRRLTKRLPDGYEQYSPVDFFAGSHRLVTLLEAFRGKAGSVHDPMRSAYFLSVSDESGEGAEVVELHLPYEPVKAAALGADEYLVLALDRAHAATKLLLLRANGDVLRVLDTQGMDFPESRSGGVPVPPTPATSNKLKRALMAGTFTPHGEDVVLSQANGSNILYVITPQGASSAVKLKAIANTSVLGIVASDKSALIVVRLRQAGDVSTLAEKKILENPGDLLAEYDMATGEPRKVFKTQVNANLVTTMVGSTLYAVYSPPLPEKQSPTNASAAVETMVLGSAQIP